MGSMSCAKYRLWQCSAPPCLPAWWGGEFSVSLVFAAIAPHGGLAIAEACSPDERLLAVSTRAGMEELGRLFAAARPEAVVVATPHNVHIANALGVVVSGRVAGRLAGAPPSVALDVPAARGPARLGLGCHPPPAAPALGRRLGSTAPRNAGAPMDAGVL